MKMSFVVSKSFLLAALVIVPAQLTASQAVAVTASGQGVQIASGKNAGGITLQLNNVTLERALDAIAENAGLALSWDRSVNSARRKVSLNVHNASVDAVLAQVTKGTGLSAQITSDRQTIVISPFTSSAKQRAQGTISGRVTDSRNNQVISGATISVGGREAATNETGRYSLAGVSAGTHTLTIRALGYTKQSRQVSVQKRVIRNRI